MSMTMKTNVDFDTEVASDWLLEWISDTHGYIKLFF